MPASTYKLLSIGLPVGMGATNSVFVAMSGVAKKATLGSPFTVANELFCNGIARQLMLPCPPGAVTDIAGETHYFSLDFNVSGLALPPIDAGQLVAFDAELCWQIIAFDAFVMNPDRHAQNITHNTTSHETQIFDHSHALLGSSTDYVAFWAGSINNLGIGGHCLAAHIATAIGRDEAIRRIMAIDDYVLEALVEDCCSIGFPVADKVTFVDKMKDRRNTLKALFDANMNQFPNLPPPPAIPPTTQQVQP